MPNHSSLQHHPPPRSPNKTAADGGGSAAAVSSGTAMMSSGASRASSSSYTNNQTSSSSAASGSGHGTLMHQPHGVPALGPAPSTLAQQQQYYAMQQQNQNASSQGGSETSPLPPMVQRSLGDRSNEKRKNAALEIEALIKSLTETSNFATINAVIAVLSKDFCTSMNSNYRKGGLVGLAATAIGLHTATINFLHVLLPPVLHCFDDPESRVRYYACESIYNMAKVSRQGIMAYFNPIFEGLTKLFADVDVDVKNGANLLNRLIKDIVTEADADTFQVDQFLPVMQNYIRRTNPFIRQLIVGWITLLDSLPDFSLLVYLPDFLDGLFNMLSDSNREIRQAADSALSDFLRELSGSQVLEFGPIISTLVFQCQSKERLNRLTAITWLAELTHHPLSGGDALLPFLPEILQAILYCISDQEKDIRLVADRTNDDLLQLVRDTAGTFELRPVLETLTNEMLEKEDVPTKMAALRWINMLMEKRMYDMQAYTVNLLPVLLRTLSDPSDVVVLLDLQVLSRISLAVVDHPNKTDGSSGGGATTTTNGNGELPVPRRNIDGDETLPTDNGTALYPQPVEAQFQLVLNAILNLFAQDRQLLETRGSLIIRKLCVLLNAKAVYIRMADTLSSYEHNEHNTDQRDQAATLQFISTMVQTLNLILLTASELHDLRSALANSFEDSATMTNRRQQQSEQAQPASSAALESNEKSLVFATIFHCWCHNPVSTFSLCLLAKAYDLSFALVKRFSEMEDVSVGFLMQIDKLVYLLESPIFVHLRLQLLNVEAPYHANLLKSIYGILMCLPQGDAFRLLNDRLTTVCNLRDNLGVVGHERQNGRTGDENGERSNARDTVSKRGLDMDRLLDRFDRVVEQHRQAKGRVHRTTATTLTDPTLTTEATNVLGTTTATGPHHPASETNGSMNAFRHQQTHVHAHSHHPQLQSSVSMTPSFGRDRSIAMAAAPSLMSSASMATSPNDMSDMGALLRGIQKSSPPKDLRRI